MNPRAIIEDFVQKLVENADEAKKKGHVSRHLIFSQPPIRIYMYVCMYGPPRGGHLAS